jgi:hypothetical protein
VPKVEKRITVSVIKLGKRSAPNKLDSTRPWFFTG